MYLLAIAILDADGRVIHVNQAARNMLASGDVISLSDTERLQFKDPSGHMLVREARRALFEKGQRGKGSSIYVTDEQGAARYSVSMVPMGAMSANKSWAGCKGRGPSPLLALCIGHGPAKLGAVRQSLCVQFGLTPSESDAVMQLFEGLTPKQIAAQRAVSVHTVRNQIKAAYAKTETKRLNELVKLAAEVQAGLQAQVAL